MIAIPRDAVPGETLVLGVRGLCQVVNEMHTNVNEQCIPRGAADNADVGAM